MALILQNCRFLHTPKTGGTWVRTALSQAGVVFAETDTWHVELARCPGRGMYTIAFVRHPWSWWKSYWLYKRSHGWDFHNTFDLQCMENQFERFLIRVLQTRPGHCSDVFRRFVGTEDRQVDFVGRFENLVDDLVAGLVKTGEPFDEHRLRATRIENAGNYRAFSTNCSAEVRRQVLEAEREAMVRFYDDPSAADPRGG